MKTKNSNFEVWPKNWPEYHNASSDACDVRIGPCACGAWHQEGEFELRPEGLFRYGHLVATK